MSKTESLFVRALHAARAEMKDLDAKPSRERMQAIYAGAAAPAGGWRSKTLATRKAYLDAIEKHLVARKIKYVRARTLIMSSAPQKKLDEIGELVHLIMRKKSEGHVAWQVIHPEGLNEYFLVDGDLYRASHVHPIDSETGLRQGAVKIASGLPASVEVIKQHGLQTDEDFLKKLKKRR